MFRQPGMSRQPAGILASSPQLANTVANRQPVRMANGGTNTYTAAVQRAVQAGDKRSLQELAKPINYGAAARTPDAQNALRLATQALARSTQISTDAAIDAPVSDAERMAANRGNLAALRAAQGLDQGATVPATTDNSPSILDRGIAAAKSAVTGDYMRPLTDAIVKGVRSDADSIESILNTDTRMSPANVAARSRVPSMDDNPPDATGNVFREAQEARAKAIADANMGETIPPFGDEFGNIAPDGTMPGETLAASTTTPTTGKPLKVSTVDPDAPPPKTAAVKKLEAIRNNITSNVPDGVKGKAPKLSVNEALDPEVLPELANNIADRVAVKDVDLDKIDAELKKEFNFDPSKASKEKEGAFWTALMQAGLAIAAGESENALTNIAKGLSLGVDAYGKAVGELNEQEREDRKEMRQARRQLIRDERSFNIADAAAANQYKQYMTTAKQKFEVDSANLGIQQAQLNFQIATKQADQALAVQQFDANLAVLIAAEGRKDRTLVINEKTLQATIDKLEPKNITTFRRLGYIDADGKVTQLGIDEFGGEKETRAAILAQGTSSKSTDADKNAAAFARALEARRTGQKISAADLARLPQKMQEDFTLLDQFIDDSSTLKKGVEPPVIDLSSN